MNSIILTALENKCPLNIFSFLDFRMTKNTKHKIDILNIKIVYHCILQYSIFGAKVILFYLATTPTYFICCKARLVTRILSFMCLHSIYMTYVVTNNEIIAVTNRKNIYCIVVVKRHFCQVIVILYQYAFLANQKFPCFYDETGEQSLLVSLVMLVIQN